MAQTGLVEAPAGPATRARARPVAPTAATAARAALAPVVRGRQSRTRCRPAGALAPPAPAPREAGLGPGRARAPVPDTMPPGRGTRPSSALLGGFRRRISIGLHDGSWGCVAALVTFIASVGFHYQCREIAVRALEKCSLS